MRKARCGRAFVKQDAKGMRKISEDMNHVSQLFLECKFAYAMKMRIAKHAEESE